MLSSAQLKKIVTEARPLIEQQLDLTEQVAGLREVVTAAGGDWSQLKALVKAQIQDERDEAGDGKRVRKILDKADYAQGYADMLGLAPKMNEKNSFADVDPETRRKMRLSEAMLDNKALSAEMLRDGLISPEAHAENVAIADGVARKLGAGVIDAETGEIIENTEPAPPAEPDVAADAESQPLGTAGGDAGQAALSATLMQEGSEPIEAHNLDRDGSTPSPATSTPSVESVNEPLVTVATDANAGGDHARVVQDNSHTQQAGAAAGETAAAPGSIWTEHTPPEGLVWHEYLRPWPEIFGREFAELLDDVRANGVREPIIRQGNVVISGRARYLAARQALVEYPVQEYAGDDPLADIIAWNMASRKPHLVARQMIAKSLIKLVPDRADEIGELLDLQQQREAAQ